MYSFFFSMKLLVLLLSATLCCASFNPSSFDQDLTDEQLDQLSQLMETLDARKSEFRKKAEVVKRSKTRLPVGSR